MKYFQLVFTIYLLVTGLSPAFSQTLIATLAPSDLPTATVVVEPTQATSDNPTPTATVVVPTIVTPTEQPTVIATSLPTETVAPTSTELPTTMAPTGLLSMIAPFGSFSPAFSNNVYSYGYTPAAESLSLNPRIQFKVDNNVRVLQVSSCYESTGCSAQNYDLYRVLCSGDCNPDQYYTYISNVDSQYLSVLAYMKDGSSREYNINLYPVGSTPIPTATSSPTIDPTAPTLIPTLDPTAPTFEPTATATSSATLLPTQATSDNPTPTVAVEVPTIQPETPTVTPTAAPTVDPTATSLPTASARPTVTPPSLSSMNSNYGILSPGFSSSRYSYKLTAYGSEYITTPAPTSTPTPSSTSAPTPTGTGTYMPTNSPAPTSATVDIQYIQPSLKNVYTTYGSLFPSFNPSIHSYTFTPNTVYDTITMRFASSVNTQVIRVAECIRPTAPPTVSATFSPTATSLPTSTVASTELPTATATSTATLLPTQATSDNPTPTVAVEVPTIQPETPTVTPTTEAAPTTSLPTSSSAPTQPADYECSLTSLVYRELCRGSSCIPNNVYDYTFSPTNLSYLSVQIVSSLLGSTQSLPYKFSFLNPIPTTTPPTSTIPPTSTVAPTTIAPTLTPTPSSSMNQGSWVYLGCFRDSSTSRILSQKLNIDGAQTNDLCQRRAMSLGYLYAGTQYGNECWGGKVYLPGPSSTNCNMNCVGNSTQTCGGFYATSIYYWLPFGATINPSVYPSAITPSIAPTSTELPTATATASVAPTDLPTATVLPTDLATVLPTATVVLPTDVPTATIIPDTTMMPPTDAPTDDPMMTPTPTQIVENPTFTLPTAISGTNPASDAPTATVTVLPTQATSDNPTPTAVVIVPTVVSTPTATTLPTMTIAPTTSAPTGTAAPVPFSLFLSPQNANTMRISVCNDDKCSFNPSSYSYVDICTLCDASTYQYPLTLISPSTYVLVQLFSSNIGVTSPLDYDGVITTYIINVVVEPSDSTPPSQGYWQYLGCYSYTPASSSLTPLSSILMSDNPELTNAYCQSKAAEFGYIFAATFGSTCYGGTYFNQASWTSSDTCSMMCPGEPQPTTTAPVPTVAATLAPTLPPTYEPTATATSTATLLPTQATSDNPTPTVAVEVPTIQPETPTVTPTVAATFAPTVTVAPTVSLSVSQICGGDSSFSIFQFINTAPTTVLPTVPSPTLSTSIPTTIVATGFPTPSLGPTVIVVPTATATSTATIIPSPTSTVLPTPSLSVQPTALSTDPNAAALFSLTFLPSSITQQQITDIQNLIAAAGGNIPVSRVVITSPQLVQSSHHHRTLSAMLLKRVHVYAGTSLLNVKILPSSTGPSVNTVLLNLLGAWANPQSALRSSPLFQQLGFDDNTSNINVVYVCANGAATSPCAPNENGLLAVNDNIRTSSSSSSSSSSLSTGSIVSIVFSVLIVAMIMMILGGVWWRKQQQQTRQENTNFAV